MRFTVSTLSLVGFLLSGSAGYAAESLLSSMRCFVNTSTSVTAYPPSKEAAIFSDAYHSPNTLPRLETLDLLSIGMS
ncbi:type VI lipase adapter Tla3 domain-containing protein, partial [Pseudomonas aeruginosa]